MGVKFEPGQTPWNKGHRGTKNPKVAKRLKEYFSNPENRAKKSGEHGSNWKGNNVSYNAMHTRMRKTQTHICVNCGPVAKTQLALIHGRGTHISLNNRAYSVNVNDYQEMCAPCHWRYDNVKADNDI